MKNPFEVEEVKNNSLIKLDEFEEKIQLLQKITKEYDDLKKMIKEEMLQVAKEMNSKQLKWTTPKDIKITLSIGQPAITKKIDEMRFSEEVLRTKYPEIYEECKVNFKNEVVVQNKTYDKLIITLPKDRENK